MPHNCNFNNLTETIWNLYFLGKLLNSTDIKHRYMRLMVVPKQHTVMAVRDVWFTMDD